MTLTTKQKAERYDKAVAFAKTELAIYADRLERGDIRALPGHLIIEDVLEILTQEVSDGKEPEQDCPRGPADFCRAFACW
jgi:hypothetical protein